MRFDIAGFRAKLKRDGYIEPSNFISNMYFEGQYLHYFSTVNPHTDIEVDSNNEWEVHFRYWAKDYVFIHNGYTNPIIQERTYEPIKFRFKRYHAFIHRSEINKFKSKHPYWKDWDERKTGPLRCVFYFIN